MRIGITVHFQHSFFSAGSPQTALSAAECYRLQGHDVFFINVGGEATWWDDVKTVGSEWTSVNAKDLSGSSFAEGADLSIEIGTNYLKPAMRSLFKKSVWLCRKPMIFRDIEASLFPFEHPDRNLDGISEVWLFKEHTNSDDIQYCEILLRKPVRLLPYTWTPTAVESHRQEAKAPIWPQVAQLEEAKGKPWSIHICETNTSSASSCTIPLLIMREVKKKTSIPLSPIVKIHNADNIKQSEFFRANVLAHVFSDITDMSGMFIGRQRVVDFVYDPYSVVVAHTRFLTVRHYLFDTLWVGIPLVHNSPVLKGMDMGHYYDDNEISQGKKAFESMVAAPATVERVIENRKKILEISPLSPAIQQQWCDAMKSVLERVDDAVGAAVGAASPAATAAAALRIGFSDMWDGFNPEYNQFTLLLQAAMPKYSIVGVAYKAGTPIDVLIFGPFGDTWKTATVPKVHYTGENTDPKPEAALNIGFQHLMANDGKYLRLPLWMLEINWFRADAERIQNPKPIPINRACRVYSDEFSEKKKFCAFVVTNPRQPFRNAAFEWLSQYKKVDSAGRLFNNVGQDIFAGLGGGGGELKKLDFLRNYKFCLAYENESAPGYTTEKYLHAKAAGCIPIYWGDPKVERDFDMAGAIDARGVKTAAELIRLVQEVDADEGLWKKKFAVPAVDEIRRDTVRRTLSECARRILGLVLDAKELEGIPPMLGYTEDLPGAGAGAGAGAVLDDTVLITACNAKFLPSLKIWLGINGQHRTQMKGLQYVVYLMADVDAAAADKITQEFPFTQIRRFPTETPTDFKDLWAPEHFAWKIWLMREANTLFAGKPVLYMDSGVAMIRFPWDWIRAVCSYELCVLLDPREFNRYRCHSEFNKAMAVSAEELAANQIWAGSMAFVAGADRPVKIMNEAWEWAQRRNVIVGAKWTGEKIDGHYFGHRHDQSILSVLCKRIACASWPLDDIYCDISLRHTFNTGKYLYAHRGMFKVHDPIVCGVDEAWVINLDRRADRLEKFKATHPELAGRIMRLPAFEGTKLTLTPKIARLFAPHDFKWKKPVMGCALSHLALWTQLVHERPEINSYFIMEDDARVDSRWRHIWEAADNEKQIPADWDLVYLGGILPPNREAFEQEGVEKVNDYFARVKENSIFGQNPPNRYFHFCAYAYILTRRGAQKILDVLKARGGYWTSADHMMCNIERVLNIYFFNPLVAGCYQDDDPVYRNSKFNDFSRLDKFDSDLWSNNEHFSEEEVKAVADADAPLDILGALEDARAGAGAGAAGAAAGAAGAAAVRVGKRRIVSFHETDSSKWHEFAWLKYIFQNDVSLNVELLSAAVSTPVPTDEPIVFIQRPHVEAARAVLMRWAAQGGKFYVLHLSDEYGTDPVDFYHWPSCLGVLRNYIRPDVVESDRIRVMPLGFHWAVENSQPVQHTPRPPFREYVWSFVGTGWAGRAAKLDVLKGVPGQNKCVLMDDWNSPKMLGREETLSILLNSWCVPCPMGQNTETYRFYEALDAGAVPILVKEAGMDEYMKFLGRWLPLLVADGWPHAAQLIHTLKAKPEVYEKYRSELLGAWENMRADVRKFARSVFRV